MMPLFSFRTNRTGSKPAGRFVVTLLAVAAVSGVAAPRAQADSIVYIRTVPTMNTNFNSSITVPQFNPTMGTLNSIAVSLLGMVTGSTKFESLDPAPATVTDTLKALISVNRPNNSLIVSANPSVVTTTTVGAFDGIIDYGGTSGRTFNNQSNSDFNSALLTSPVDRTLFTGVSTITLPVTGVSQSNATSAGSLIAQFATQAEGQINITYNYTPLDTPEPGSLPLLGVGLTTGLGAAGMVKRRRANATNKAEQPA